MKKISYPSGQNVIADTVIEEHIVSGVGDIFAGCIVGCASKDKTFVAASGTTDGITPMTTEALFDIASITKAILNVTALHELSASELREKIITQVAMSGRYRDQITVEHLLTFAVEYGDSIRLSQAVDKEDLLQKLLHGDLPRIPGPLYRYTNVSSMLLGFYLEAKFGQTLDAFLKQRLFSILGMESTTFTPSLIGNNLVRIESTLPKGTIQDESARIYGKPSGSSGLFSTAADLLRFGQSFLIKDSYLPKSLIQKMSMSQFGADAALTFGYGMGLRHQNECDLLNDDGTPMTVLKKNGFSGAHFCILPENDFVFVSLANICFPHRASSEKRDSYSRFHRKLLRFMYERREQLL